MTDLDKLIAAVAAGNVTSEHLPDSLVAVWQPIVDALYGSLDAAHRLQEALLHERCVMSLTYSVRYDAKVFIADPIENEVWDSGQEWMDPARAWLLAVLRAMKAQGGDK